MKKVTLLAYRNNQTWQALQEAVQAKAAKKAASGKSELLVKIFEPTDGPDVIDAWIDSATPEYEFAQTVTDGTVGSRLQEKGFKLEWPDHDNLNCYLDLRHKERYTTMSLEDVMKAAYLRINEAVKPDLWVIVTNNLSDYDPFGIMGEERYNEKVTQAERDAYVEKFRSLVPSGQVVEVFPYSGRHNPSSTFNRNAIKGRRVVMICHHHAAQGLGKPGPLDGSLEGSLCLDTLPDAFLPNVCELIRVDDIIGGDVIEKIRKRLMAGD